MPAHTVRHPRLGCIALAIGILTGGCRLADVGRGAMSGGASPAGSDTAESLRVPVRDAVAALLARHVPPAVIQASYASSDTGGPAAKRICIVPLAAPGPDGDQVAPRLGAIIQQRIDESDSFEAIAPRFVASGLEAARLRPADLRVPEQRTAFTRFMEQQGQDVDSLLLAAIEPAAAGGRRVLTLTLVDARTGVCDEVRHTLPATGSAWLRGPPSAD
jgi:hypothetical protein